MDLKIPPKTFNIYLWSTLIAIVNPPMTGDFTRWEKRCCICSQQYLEVKHKPHKVWAPAPLKTCSGIQQVNTPVFHFSSFIRWRDADSTAVCCWMLADPFMHIQEKKLIEFSIFVLLYSIQYILFLFLVLIKQFSTNIKIRLINLSDCILA